MVGPTVVKTGRRLRRVITFAGQRRKEVKTFVRGGLKEVREFRDCDVRKEYVWDWSVGGRH